MIRLSSVYYLTLIGALSLPIFAHELPLASPAEVGLDAARLSEISELTRAMVEESKIAGAVTMVARRGRVVHFDACGWQDIESQTPLKTDSIFRIYSMTKPVTSVAVMMLYEEGKIHLDAPVSRYLAEFKHLKVVGDTEADKPNLVDGFREMTVRDLLRHTSGLTYGYFGDTNVDRLYQKRGLFSTKSLEEMMAALVELPLLYQPGSRWNYSVSTDVLGYLVEVASGKGLDVFFQERIFSPLGMNDTAFSVPTDKIDRFTTNYAPNGKGGLSAFDKPMASNYAKPATLLSGGGGLVSTAMDYMIFAQMLLNGGTLRGTRLLQPETVAMMTRNHLSKDLMPIAIGGEERPGIGFGLGFAVCVEPQPHDPGSRSDEYSWDGAASTHFWISPQDDVAVVVLTQYMPFSDRLKKAIKPVVYQSLGQTAGAH